MSQPVDGESAAELIPDSQHLVDHSKLTHNTRDNVTLGSNLLPISINIMSVILHIFGGLMLIVDILFPFGVCLASTACFCTNGALNEFVAFGFPLWSLFIILFGQFTSWLPIEYLIDWAAAAAFINGFVGLVSILFGIVTLILMGSYRSDYEIDSTTGLGHSSGILIGEYTTHNTLAFASLLASGVLHLICMIIHIIFGYQVKEYNTAANFGWSYSQFPGEQEAEGRWLARAKNYEKKKKETAKEQEEGAKDKRKMELTAVKKDLEERRRKQYEKQNETLDQQKKQNQSNSLRENHIESNSKNNSDRNNINYRNQEIGDGGVTLQHLQMLSDNNNY